MAAPGQNGLYTGQTYTNENGERYVWIGNEWRFSGASYASPTANPRRVNITFNTFLEGSNIPTQVKVLVNDTEWSDSSSSNGKVNVTFFEYQLLNPTKITFVGNNVKALKTYMIKAKAGQDNEVTITEMGSNGMPINAAQEVVISTPSPGGGGGGGGFTSGVNTRFEIGYNEDINMGVNNIR